MKGTPPSHFSFFLKPSSALELMHNIGWRTSIFPFPLHKVHIRCHMFEETVISLAEVIEPVIAVTVSEETVFRTFTVTGKKKITFLTLPRQPLQFHF